MQPCNRCGLWVCSCRSSSLPPFGVVAAVDPGKNSATVMIDGTVLDVDDFEFNMGTLADEDKRRQERFAQAVGIVAEELANGRAVVRTDSEQAVKVFGDPYTLRCFRLDGELHPGEIVVPQLDSTPLVVYALRPGYPVKLEGPYCRWCAGDGIDHRHSNRVRALLVRDSTRGSRIAMEQPRIQVVPGVSKGRPFNDWLLAMQEAAFGVDELLASIGRTEAELRCRRCMGSGR